MDCAARSASSASSVALSVLLHSVLLWAASSPSLLAALHAVVTCPGPWPSLPPAASGAALWCAAPAAIAFTSQIHVVPFDGTPHAREVRSSRPTLEVPMTLQPSSACIPASCQSPVKLQNQTNVLSSPQQLQTKETTKADSKQFWIWQRQISYL